MPSISCESLQGTAALKAGANGYKHVGFEVIPVYTTKKRILLKDTEKCHINDSPILGTFKEHFASLLGSFLFKAQLLQLDGYLCKNYSSGT